MSTQEINIKSTEFQAKNEFILVKPVTVQEKVTESGLVLAFKPSVLDVSTSGTVVNVGKDITDIAEGDFIIWPASDGLELQFLDGLFRLLRYKSVIGTKKAL